MGKEPTTPKSPATRKIIGKSARGSFQRAGSAESVKVKTASGHKVTTTSSGAVAEEERSVQNDLNYFSY